MCNQTRDRNATISCPTARMRHICSQERISACAGVLAFACSATTCQPSVAPDRRVTHNGGESPPPSVLLTRSHGKAGRGVGKGKDVLRDLLFLVTTYASALRLRRSISFRRTRSLRACTPPASVSRTAHTASRRSPQKHITTPSAVCHPHRSARWDQGHRTCCCSCSRDSVR